MKTQKLWGLLLLLVGALGFSGCSDEDDGYYHSTPGGGYSTRANTVHFYYINEEGGSLIDQSLSATYPMPCADKEAQIPLPEVDEYGYYYPLALTACKIVEDEAGAPYFSCYFPVDESTDTYSFYVYSNGSFDRFDLTYGYTNDALGGNGWAAHVLSLKINGQHVYSDEEERKADTYCKVYLQKTGEDTRVWSEY